jgi:hypothetical protein
MDTKRVFLALFGTLLILNGINCDGSCPVYNCATLPTGQCTYDNNTSVPDSFLLQRCDAGKYCPQLIANSTCEVTPSPLYYPGSPCSLDSECTSRNCTANTCVGLGLGDVCTTQDECLIGLSCRLNDTAKVCMTQLGAGQTCTSDYDCQNSLGCFNSTCTPYFSVADGVEVGKDRSIMCSSAMVNNGVCATLKNANSTDTVCSIDTDCVYQSGNDTVTITGACTCGFNKDANKYCKLGSDNDYYRNYVAAARKILTDTSLCHTSERMAPYCVLSLKKNRAVSFRKAVQSFGNNHIMAKSYPLLVHADTCVKYVAFDYDDGQIMPDTFQCAKFSCNKTSSVCFHSFNPFNDDGSNVTVSLNKVCNSTQSCFVSNTGVNGIYSKDTIDGQCVTNPTITPTVIRLPGEECSKDDDCLTDGLFNSTCVSGKCSGYAENAACNKTSQCLVGLYCKGSNDTVSGNCTKQISEGGACSSTWDCSNNLFCYNSTCKIFGSLTTGSDVSSTTLGDFSKEPSKNLVCEFGTVATAANGTSICSRIDYDGTTAANVVDGFSNCTWGSDCSYTDGINKFSYKCGCGYNADGIGYCPISHKQSNFY